jgi:hypothetical protein
MWQIITDTMATAMNRLLEKSLDKSHHNIYLSGYLLMEFIKSGSVTKIKLVDNEL